MAVFRDTASAIGAELELEDFADFARDRANLRALHDQLDRRVVVRIASHTPIAAESIAQLTEELGRPAVRNSPMAIPGFGFIQDFSAKAKLDDGRERQRNFIEDLHYDVFANGPAAYGVQILHDVCDTVPMRFVDMRAVWASLSDDTKAKLEGAELRHIARAPQDGSKPPSSLQPVAARHPRSGEPVLLLCNRRNARFENVDDDEGRDLNADLWRAVEACPVRYERVMASNEIYVWDNIACVHDNPAFPRERDRRSWFFNILREGAIEPLRGVRLVA